MALQNNNKSYCLDVKDRGRDYATCTLIFCDLTRPTESLEHIVLVNILLPSMREVLNSVQESL